MWPKDNAYAYPRVAKKKIKKGTVTSIKKQLNKIEGEVGMAVQESIQTRVVGMIMYMLRNIFLIIPTTLVLFNCFFMLVYFKA